MGLGGVEGKSICKDRKNEGVENPMPVGIIKTLDRVPKNAKGMDGRVGMICHDGHMMHPIEVLMDEDA